MLTGSSLIPKTHAPLRGAGQILPVNSGKLLVIINRCQASYHLSWKTNSFHFGITLEIGHPVSEVQKGTPQSIHLAVSCFNSSLVSLDDISFQSLLRSVAGLYFSLRRLYFMNPRTLSNLTTGFLAAAESVTVSSTSKTGGS